MKRDDDYLRELLLRLEADDEWMHILPGGTLSPSKEEEKERYHLELASDVGFVVPVGQSTFRLTFQAHDYLDAIRDDGIWKKTKDGAAKVGGMTLGMMRDLALAYVKQEAKEKLGIQL